MGTDIFSSAFSTSFLMSSSFKNIESNEDGRTPSILEYSNLEPSTRNLKNCQVVLEDISNLVAVKQKVTNQCQGNTHRASSHSKDRRYLKQQLAKPLVSWPKMDDEDEWSRFDDVVFGKLESVSPVEKRVKMLCDTIYMEGRCLYVIIRVKLRVLRRVERSRKRRWRKKSA